MSLRDQFDEEGYVLVKGVYAPEEVRELEAEFDRIIDQILRSGEEVNARWSGPEVDRMGAANTIVLHTHNVQHYSAAWTRALLHSRFLAAATDILGPNVVLHHTKLFQKPAEKGAPFPMHQDWGYFPSVRDTMVAGIIHVSPATDEMGCLRVYPGTHKLGRLDASTGHDLWMEENYPLAGATPLEAEPGDVLFFHYCTIHGSMPNTSDRTRKTVLAQLHAGNDEIEDWVTHPNARLCLAGWNPAATRSKANA